MISNQSISIGNNNYHKTYKNLVLFRADLQRLMFTFQEHCDQVTFVLNGNPIETIEDVPQDEKVLADTFQAKGMLKTEEQNISSDLQIVLTLERNTATLETSHPLTGEKEVLIKKFKKIKNQKETSRRIQTDIASKGIGIIYMLVTAAFIRQNQSLPMHIGTVVLALVLMVFCGLLCYKAWNVLLYRPRGIFIFQNDLRGYSRYVGDSLLLLARGIVCGLIPALLLQGILRLSGWS